MKDEFPCFLQALAVEMDAQNERLGWLNKHAPQILASPSVSTQSRDHHVGKLRAINLKWSKVKLKLQVNLDSLFRLFFFFHLILPIIFFSWQVTHDLLDKVGEVETNLQSHTLFQDRMAKLTDWVIITNQTIVTRGLNPVQAQVVFQDRITRGSMHEYSDSSFSFSFYSFAGSRGLNERQEEGPGGLIGSFYRAAETSAAVASGKGPWFYNKMLW